MKAKAASVSNCCAKRGWALRSASRSAEDTPGVLLVLLLL